MIRNDSVGMFWVDLPPAKGQKAARMMPPIPETGWKPPSYFPDLSSATCISLDTETWDPELIDHGPGWARGKGHIVGVSIGVPGGYKWYFPFRHQVVAEDNMPENHVLAWLRDTLGNPNQPKIGANIIYDLGWLEQEGIEVKGDLYDIQYAEALLEENAEVALEVLAQKYLGEGKESSLLYRWCSDYYGGPVTGKQRANIYRAPPRLVGPYAESDADLPIRIMDRLYPLLHKEGLFDLYRMECDLIRFLVRMRRPGVRVDLEKATALQRTLEIREKEFQHKLDKEVGFSVDINASASLAKAFDKLKLTYGRTEKGAPSFTKDFLAGVEHPVGEMIREIRKCFKLRGTFIESYVLKSHVNGKIYCQFHPLRGDDGGTRSGRYSSSTPNLQNLPSRDDELAPLVRGLFVPDVGHVRWRKFDYSQIEYRFLAHFAVGAGSDDLRRRYCLDPNTDYHELTRLLVKEITGVQLPRKATKTINFGLIYGMGLPKLTRSLGLATKEGKELFAAYHKGAPFAKATMDLCSETARRTGVIQTILGRKSRFDLWEPDGRREGIALPYKQAAQKYGLIRRAYTHKALNRKLQGSAADLMKMATWICTKEGIFERIGYPRITVHDELDFSDPGGVDDGFIQMRKIMESAIPLFIPVKADEDIGPDWGHCSPVE